jgi:hypothetical protein
VRAGAFWFDRIARGMSSLSRSGGQSIQVRPVPHKMINLAEHRSGLWGDPPVRSGPKTDNEKLALRP